MWPRTADGGRRGAPGAALRLRRGVQDVAQSPDRDPELLEVLPQPCQPQHRRGDAPGQHVEGDELAHRHAALHHPPRAEPQHRGHAKPVHQLHRL